MNFQTFRSLKERTYLRQVLWYLLIFIGLGLLITALVLGLWHILERLTTVGGVLVFFALAWLVAEVLFNGSERR